MDEKRKQGWVEFVTALLGEEWVQYALKNPSSPTLGYQPGDVPLGDWVDLEERFLYSLLPTPDNCQRILIISHPLITTIWVMWWGLVMRNHRLFGSLGVRMGWELVQPQYEDREDCINALLKIAKGVGKQVAVGEFRIKQEGGEKILPS